MRFGWISVPLGSKPPPKVFCAPPVEALPTSIVLASSKGEHLGTTSSPTNGTLVDVGMSVIVSLIH